MSIISASSLKATTEFSQNLTLHLSLTLWSQVKFILFIKHFKISLVGQSAEHQYKNI